MFGDHVITLQYFMEVELPFETQCGSHTRDGVLRLTSSPIQGTTKEIFLPNIQPVEIHLVNFCWS